MVQAPAATVMTVVPETAHAGVPARNETGSPEVAVARRAAAAPMRAPFGWAKVIVCATFPAVTWKDCVTSGAAVNRALPPWVAVMVHIPGARVVTVVPASAQSAGVPEPKATVRPEVVVAASGTSVPTVTAGSGPKAIFWGCAPAWISREWATSGAALKVALPPWEAVMVHMPASRAVTVVPDTVHTWRGSDRKDTGSREVAEAVSTTRLPATIPAGCVNAIRCGLVPAWILIERATAGAGA